MADSTLDGDFPTKGLYQALAIAAMCLQEEAGTRPVISDVVTALEYLAISNAGQLNENTEQVERDSSHHESRTDENAYKGGDDAEDETSSPGHSDVEKDREIMERC